VNQIVKTTVFSVSTIQSNHSLQIVTPVINRFVNDLLVNILPAGAHSVLEVVQVEYRNMMYSLLQSLPFSIVN